MYPDTCVTYVSDRSETPDHTPAPRRDPKDEPYVNLAIERAARFIVSRDADLLDLMEDEMFRKRYPGITVLDPVAFLTEVRTEVARELGYP